MNNFLRTLFLLLLFVVAGCATGGGRSRGSLSDAMGKASDEHEGDRTVTTTYEDDDDDDDDEGFGLLNLLLGGTENPQTPEPKPQSHPRPVADTETQSFFLLFTGGPGSIYNKALYGHFQGGIGIGAPVTDHSEVIFTGRFSHSNIQETSEMAHSISGGLDFLEVDFTHRNYTTRNYTFIGHYLLAGVGVSWINWHYKHPLIAVNGSTTTKISNDSLGGLDIFMGTGFQLFQTAPVRCNLEIVPGIYLWGLKTSEAFTNDYFGPMPYINLRFSLHFGSPR